MSINIVTAGGIPVDGNHFSKNGYLNDQYFDLFAPPPISITSWGGDLDYIQNEIKKYEFSKSEHNSRSISNRLLDEPSLGLSPKLQKELFKTIHDLKKDGLAILIVEQNAKKAIEIADRTYLLENGTIVLSGGSEILEHKEIKQVYLGGHY